MPTVYQRVISKSRKPTIRKASETDISAVLSLWRQYVEPNIVPWKVGDLFKSSKPHWFVADASTAPYVSEVVGFIAGTIVDGVGNIAGFAIHPESGGKGIGTELIKAIEKHFKEAGLTECTLYVRKSNTRAQRFYEKNGYVSIAELEDYYPDNLENGLVYHKQL